MNHKSPSGKRPFRTGLFLPVAMLTLILAPCTHPPASAAPAPAPRWLYRILPGSWLIDDCPVCDGPTVPEPLTGTFELRQIEANPLFATYAVENIQLQAGSDFGRSYTVRGSGRYTVGGEVALVQSLTIDVQIDDGLTNRACTLTNTTPIVNRLWPMLEVDLQQTNGTATQVYHLNFSAAPFHQIWFSTRSGMTPGSWHPPTNHISGGDLLASVGQVVKRNAHLTRELGSVPTPPGEGLDALDLLPGGEVVFSLENDLFSETLGLLHHGDLISSRGHIVQRNQQLTGPFKPRTPATDTGLDAAQVMDNGDILFSVATEFVSDTLQQTVGAGDLLSGQGVIVKSNRQLLSRFQPADPEPDYGLDAIHVWPSGEIWFSVESGFQGPNFENYGHGDLLSDQGYVVYRNLQLVGPFQPVEDLADFGLDALFIITDTTPPAPEPVFTRIDRVPATGEAGLLWEGTGRVWQVLRSGHLPGTWMPASPLMPDVFFQDTTASQPASFYQLRQW